MKLFCVRETPLYGSPCRSCHRSVEVRIGFSFSRKLCGIVLKLERGVQKCVESHGGRQTILYIIFIYSYYNTRYYVIFCSLFFDFILQKIDLFALSSLDKRSSRALNSPSSEVYDVSMSEGPGHPDPGFGTPQADACCISLISVLFVGRHQSTTSSNYHSDPVRC